MFESIRNIFRRKPKQADSDKIRASVGLPIEFNTAAEIANHLIERDIPIIIVIGDRRTGKLRFACHGYVKELRELMKAVTVELSNHGIE